MEIYEARDILESNGYLVERTPLEARTKDRFEIPKVSKLDDVRNARKEAMFNLFSDTSNSELEKAFKLLFNKEIEHEGMEIYNAVSRSNLNELTLEVSYRTIVNNFDYLELKNEKIYYKMIDKLNHLSTITTAHNFTIRFYAEYFKIEMHIDHIKGIDTKTMVSELKKLKENLGEAMYDGIQTVKKIVKGFNSSYERAWEK